MPAHRSVDRSASGYIPLLTLSLIVVLAVIGLARGVWLTNLHNGLLALTFGAIGTYVALQRPRHRLGRLFLATGSIEAIVFVGRQIGHDGTGTRADQWWAWFGVWPVAMALALTTLSVLCFPDGRPPTRRWRPVLAAIVAVAAFCAALSALWPVEYDQVGLTSRHPVNGEAPDTAIALWSAIAQPAYVVFQALWLVAVAVRWRRAGAVARTQLAVLGTATAVSVVALAAGLVIWATPRPGILSAALVPLAAGWAVVHGQHIATYTALSWISRAGSGSADLPTGLARAVSEALDAPAATVWIGDNEMHAVGVWPESDDLVPRTTLAALADQADQQIRTIANGAEIFGALSVNRARTDQLSLTEQRLFDDLAAQGRFVIEHIGLSEIAAELATARVDGRLTGLTPRESEVLELMSRGMSNSAICRELHLSIKTVEPVVSSIFAKLGLQTDSTLNRRVLAVVAYLRA